MKYLQSGGFQNQTLMKLTLMFTLLFLTGFWVTNFALYFAKMDLSPQSVEAYYLGSEKNYSMPKTYQTMLEVTHAHLPMMAMVVLLLTHLMIFAPYSFKAKVAIIASSFGFGLLNETSSWLVRFVSPSFSWLKIISFFTFQGILGFLILGLTLFLLKSSTKTPKENNPKHKTHRNGKPQRNRIPDLEEIHETHTV